PETGKIILDDNGVPKTTEKEYTGAIPYEVEVDKDGNPVIDPVTKKPKAKGIQLILTGIPNTQDKLDKLIKEGKVPADTKLEDVLDIFEKLGITDKDGNPKITYTAPESGVSNGHSTTYTLPSDIDDKNFPGIKSMLPADLEDSKTWAIAPKEQTSPKDGEVKFDGKNKSLLELMGLDPFDEGKYYEIESVTKKNPLTGGYEPVPAGFDYNDVDGTGDYQVKVKIIDPDNVKWTSGGTTAVTRDVSVLKQKLTIADWSSAANALDEPNVTDADGAPVPNYRAYFDVEFYDLDGKLISGKDSWDFGWDAEKYEGQQLTMKLVLKNDDNVEVTEGSEVEHVFNVPAAKEPDPINSVDPTISVKDPNYDTGVDATYRGTGIPVDITAFDGKMISFLTAGTIEIRINGETVKALSDVVLKDAGTYEIELRITSKYFKWNNGGKVISQTIEVHKQQVVAPTLSNFTFDGVSHDGASLSAKGVLNGFDSATMKLTFTGAPTLRNVGDYTVVIS
ncbi:MAG: hypothetical protein K2J30_01970, partial [Clostridia bacterium]|nr:hypothetical protein [Clostridia bacterium]